jgi:hypothetical protein
MLVIGLIAITHGVGLMVYSVYVIGDCPKNI